MAVQLPFEGLKVADFSWVAVGPITSKYLGDHGTTVVRMETEGHPDILRVAGPFKDRVPGPNRSHFYRDFNSSKVGLLSILKSCGLGHRLPPNRVGRRVFREFYTRDDGCTGHGIRKGSLIKPIDSDGFYLSDGPDRIRQILGGVRLPRRGYRRVL